MSSVEGIEGNGKNCNQFSTGQVNDGKYSTSGVEESPVKGKGFEPSTGLKDVVAETLEPNSGQLSKNLELTRNNGGWQTSRERPNGAEEKRIDENILGKKDQTGEMSDQQSDEDGWTVTKSRKEQKKQKEETQGQVRKSTRLMKNTANKELLMLGGLSGVSKNIEEKLERIGLRHVSVSQEGNCAYLATSQAIYGSSNKWQTVRNLGARHLEENRDHYIADLTEEILDETISEMKTAGEYIDELGLKVIEDLYQRHVEIWMRTEDGSDIETHPIYNINEGSILMWYNGLNSSGAKGNHYDSLIVVNLDAFLLRGEIYGLGNKNNTKQETETGNQPEIEVDLLQNRATELSDPLNSNPASAPPGIIHWEELTSEPSTPNKVSEETEISLNAHTTLPSKQLDSETGRSWTETGELKSEDNVNCDDSTRRQMVEERTMDVSSGSEERSSPPIRQKGTPFKTTSLATRAQMNWVPGNPILVKQAAKERMRGLKRSARHLSDEAPISDSESSSDEEEEPPIHDGIIPTEGATKPHTESNKEHRDNYKMLTTVLRLDKETEEEVTTDKPLTSEIRALLKSVHAEGLQSKAIFTTCTNYTKLTLKVLGGEVEDKGDSVASVRDYLGKVKITLTADDLYREADPAEQGEQSMATVSLIGQNIKEIDGLKHANGKMDKDEYWTYDTVVRLAKVEKTRIEVDDRASRTTGNWLADNKRTFKPLSKRILKWCVAMVLQAELERGAPRIDQPEESMNDESHEGKSEGVTAKRNEADPMQSKDGRGHDEEETCSLASTNEDRIKIERNKPKSLLRGWTGGAKHKAKRSKDKANDRLKQKADKYESLVMALMQQGMKLQQNYTDLQRKLERFEDEDDLITPPTKKERNRRSGGKIGNRQYEEDSESFDQSIEETQTPRTEKATDMLNRLNIEQGNLGSAKKDCSSWRENTERGKEKSRTARENEGAMNAQTGWKGREWTEPRAGDGKSIQIPIAREPGTNQSMEHIEENKGGTVMREQDGSTAEQEKEETRWRSNARVGIFHETDGPKAHDPQAEEIRRGLAARIARNDKKVTGRLSETSEGHTFWRYKSWILMVDRDEDRVAQSEMTFYASANAMEEVADLHPTEEPLQEIQDWVGIALLEKFNDSRMDMLTTGEALKISGEHEDEEFALELGCTFKLCFITPRPVYEMEQAKKLKKMKEETRIYISTLGKPMTAKKKKKKSHQRKKTPKTFKKFFLPKCHPPLLEIRE